MSIFFNAHEILEMAEQIERNGARFYRQAAESIDAPEARELLLELAAMEDGHEKVFASMRADLSKRKKEAIDIDLQGQETSYLQAWADSNVFDVRSDPVKRLTGQETIEDILKIAIDLEKESIVFYLGFKEAMPKKTDRVKIDEILKEEMRHIAALSAKLSAIRANVSS